MSERADDRSIADPARLWRRIIPRWVYHEEGEPPRPQLAAFIDRHTGEVSIHIADLTTPEKALAGRPDDSLAEVTAGLARSLGLMVVRDPTEEDPSHALICPCPTKSQAKTLARAARWVVLRS